MAVFIIIIAIGATADKHSMADILGQRCYQERQQRANRNDRRYNLPSGEECRRECRQKSYGSDKQYNRIVDSAQSSLDAIDNQRERECHS